MLQLQRASAGSGKTYTLAKKFIWFLIAVKEPGRPWRLRTSREISDGLPRILAITFTNKATNEMKQRIVEKLADIARADGSEPLVESELHKIAYLKDFAADLAADPVTVGKAARTALSVLLNEYSDFKVSTIDSFFQTILRTFAYESNLNDAYQVEIDTDFLAAAAVDATLDEINNSSSPSDASFWMTELMREQADAGKTSWNVFQKSQRDDSIYTRLKKSLLRLENEDFKGIRDKLDSYFDTPDGSDPLRSAYLGIKENVVKPLMETLEEARKLAEELRRLFIENGLDIKLQGHRYLAGHLAKLRQLRFDQTSKSGIFTPLKLDGKDSILKKGESCGEIARLTDTAFRMYQAYSRWLELRESREWKHWALYAPLVPYLGMLGEARRKMHEYLESNNTIQLGETNTMLRRIIGDDDAPFIYERLGTAINHYLIDEFQDTSRLQWGNLLPLLRESESRAEDNLIIGDAKQSIYRFRNADPSLITTSVPKEFPDRVDAGMSKADNTNWRSDRTVVEFNNFFFHSLVAELAEESQGTIDFADLYRNVAQYSSHRERRGYVEVNFLSAPDDEDMAPGDDKLTKEEYLRRSALQRIGPLVASLIGRGYAQRDIALLVGTNQLAKEVIASLVAYNAALPKGEKRIEFISEESLLVSSSEAVGIIISVLEKMVSGTDVKRDSSDPSKAVWADIKCNFSFYALRNPGLTPAEQVEGFLSEESPVDSINAMLSKMQTVALPALVEAVTENFVPLEMRRTQAVFIAALQDMVLEYCDRYAADVASFLSWWNSKGVTRSISSPEGTNAVQVMTIHKSKGLEFKCVILPFANSSLLPSPMKSEWKWVRPSDSLAFAGLPPYVPVTTTASLKETEHEEVWTKYFDLYMMDSLNSAYVAFTRAVSELYVFTELPEKRKSHKLGSYLYSICNEADARLDDVADTEERSYMLPEGCAVWNDAHDVVTFGSIPDVAPAADDAASLQDCRVIEEYGVDSSPAILQYVEGDDESGATLMPDAADTDPRSEGNLLHAVMSSVKTADDIARAVTMMKTRGLVTTARAAEWTAFLSEAVGREPVRGWFHPSWKVLNERAILFPRSGNLRPDRIMVSPDGKSAVIIDYKFGAVPEGKVHIKQVNDYMKAFKEASGIKNVAGFVWYVRAGKVVEVK